MPTFISQTKGNLKIVACAHFVPNFRFYQKFTTRMTDTSRQHGHSNTTVRSTNVNLCRQDSCATKNGKALICVNAGALTNCTSFVRGRGVNSMPAWASRMHVPKNQRGRRAMQKYGLRAWVERSNRARVFSHSCGGVGHWGVLLGNSAAPYLRGNLCHVSDGDSLQGVTRKARVLCAGVTYANLCAFALRVSETFTGYFEKGAVARFSGFAEIAQAVRRSITRKIVVFERIE
ncbi:MAG: hypothetical protein WCC57_05975, partial [Paracoccaceae bacterium]